MLLSETVFAAYRNYIIWFNEESDENRMVYTNSLRLLSEVEMNQLSSLKDEYIRKIGI